jgi:uncharacterized membrane protein YoaT (DUF817 family)
MRLRCLVFVCRKGRCAYCVECSQMLNLLFAALELSIELYYNFFGQHYDRGLRFGVAMLRC